MVQSGSEGFRWSSQGLRGSDVKSGSEGFRWSSQGLRGSDGSVRV